MARHYSDWLAAFIDHAKHGEAPTHMYFWTGVSAIAGALQRKVWIDQAYFTWHPNFYIILVAPPGIVSKSTTAGIGMELLRGVPGTNFGPNIITWQALVTAFAAATNMFEDKAGVWHTQSAMTLESSELGTLLNPQDKQQVDLLVELWDGKKGAYKKETKSNGGDTVENPWINLIACTTPSWIAGNFPEYMIGGGFTSRCIFVYASEKRHLVAYPYRNVPEGFDRRKIHLTEDLCEISKLVGEMKITADAEQWGEDWYKRHYASRPATLDGEQFGGYLARKQTHMHKLAMILSASAGDSLQISVENLSTAADMLTDLEPDMAHVFGRIGRSDVTGHIDRLTGFVERHGKVTYAEAYRFVHSFFPSMREFDDVMAGCIKAGIFRLINDSGVISVEYNPAMKKAG